MTIGLDSGTGRQTLTESVQYVTQGCVHVVVEIVFGVLCL